MEGFDFSGCNLSTSLFQYVRFINCKFDNAIMNTTFFNNVIFVKCDLSRIAILYGSFMNHVSFYKTKYSEYTLSINQHYNIKVLDNAS